MKTHLGLLLLVPALLSCEGGHETMPLGLPKAEHPVKPVAVAAFDFEPDAVLLLTGGVNGRLEVCNCGGPTPGGLSRRAGLLASYRAVFPHTLTIDAGNLFYIHPDKVRHEHLLRGLEMLEYDAVVLGAAEWATEPEELRMLLPGAELTYLSSNVSLHGDGLGTVEQVEKPLGAGELAILSYVSEDALMFLPPELAARLDWHGSATLQPRIDALKAQGCVVLLVVHGSADSAVQAAQDLRDVDVIVRGHSTKTEEKAGEANGVPIVQIGGPEFVGALALKFGGGGVERWQWRAEPLTDRWPADRRLLDLYQAYTHAAMRAALDKERTAGLDYTPSKACGECHQSDYRQWQKSRHAHAYDTLVHVERAGDPDCLMCHTSGFGTEKGFYTIEKTAELVGVNCQDCHRFNLSEHLNADGRHVRTHQPPKVGQTVCMTCHNETTSPKFEYEHYLKEVVVHDHGR